MTVSLLQNFLKILRRFLLSSRPPQACRRYIWSLWSFFTRRYGYGRKKADDKGGRRIIGGYSEGVTESVGGNTRGSSVLEGRKGANYTSDEVHSTLLPSTSSTIICASEIPSNLSPYSFNNPRATISSQEPQTSAHAKHEFSLKNRSYPRISHPTVSGQPQGAAIRTGASPSASHSRLSVNTPSHRGQDDTGSRLTASPAASRISVAVQEYAGEEAEAFTASPEASRSRLAVEVPQLDQEQVSIGVPEPGNAEAGPSGGYDIGAPITTSPVEESGHTTLAEGDPADLHNKKNLGDVYEDFFPVFPESFNRYRDEYIEPLVTTFELAPMLTRFETQRLPPNWKEFLHPEGARYFLFEPKRIYTDANIYNLQIYRHAMRLINEMDTYTRKRHITLSNNVDIVLDLFYEAEDDSCCCQYYIADHTTRSVFWLDSYDADNMRVWLGVKGVTELSHIRHAIESQYWYHCQLFPDCYRLELEAVDELRDILTYWIGDVLTSMSSTVPYKINELEQMLTLRTCEASEALLHSVQYMDDKPYFDADGMHVFTGRLMHIFARQRFLDFHGQPAVRLDRGCLSPVMFSAPDTHWRELNRIWVDRCIHKAAWNKLIGNMNAEWQELILFGTVLLNANVAFLAIQSVDEATAEPHRSPAQILSFLSVVSSIGSVIIGLMLTRKNKVNHKEGAQDAAIFLNSFDRERLGLETLAILYSVPYALLMWGVLLFLASFSFYCLNKAALTVRLIVPSAWIIISFLVFWCIFTLASWNKRFNAQKTAWDEVISAIQNTYYKTAEATKNKLVALGLRQPEQETPVLRLRTPARRFSEMWRKASRKATIFSAFSALGSGSASGSRSASRRVTGEVEARSMEGASAVV
ncbi:hypothetical protein V5O48_008345 [Marasmius crinis-equi]|uniref:Uncharacterized protein n=1 Tax=Marasmius crinis-equi TaxID=585013 RepID=A0ABR3FEK7_9AGAR